MKPLPPVNMFNLLVKMHDELQPLTEKINFNKENIQHFTIITPYRSIFELTGACILLIKHQQLTGVPILTRSILEAYVELSNTINLQEYTDILHAECLDHWIKYLKLDISSEILNGNVDILNGFIKNKEKLAMQ